MLATKEKQKPMAVMVVIQGQEAIILPQVLAVAGANHLT
jgi:hypothetical protein